MDDKYWAERQTLFNKYKADRKPLDDKYWADLQSLFDKYWAERKLPQESYRLVVLSYDK